MVPFDFNLNNTLTVISAVTDVLIALITIYLFFKRFISKGLYYSDLKISSGLFLPDAIYVGIENRSLNPLIIKELYLIVEDKYKLKFPIEKPRIIEPYKLEIFEIKYSKLCPEIVSIRTLGRKTSVLAKTQNGYVFNMFCRKICIKKIRLFFKKKTALLESCEPVDIRRVLFNGKIISRHICYYIKFSRKDGTISSEVFMTRRGFLSENIPSFGNSIPEEVASDTIKLKEYLKRFANEHDLNVTAIKMPDK